MISKTMVENWLWITKFMSLSNMKKSCIFVAKNVHTGYNYALLVTKSGSEVCSY